MSPLRWTETGLALLLALGIAAPAFAAPILEKVVILQRHGVRSPIGVPGASTARDPWPAWPVAPGELTEHGRAALAVMGEGLRLRYAALLPGADCAGSERLYVWADNAGQRTQQSGKAMAAALAPGCGVTAATAPQGAGDALFHPGAMCPADPYEAKRAIAARLDQAMTKRRGEYDRALAALDAILYPGMAPSNLAGDNKVLDGGRVSGPLADASTLSEDLFLEYADGMTASGWGRIGGAGDVAAFMPLHNIYADLGRRTPALAAHGGTLLLRQIENVLDSRRPFVAWRPCRTPPNSCY